MPASMISVENLSKRYLVGHRDERGGRHGYTALRDVIGREMRNVTRKALDVLHGRQVVQGDTVEEFWALNDVSFDVQQGEVLGIIGRNGAGKSTLLKILSRITEPTAGRITLRGRVASLLEVGTGFHPELTGRENIYLNGAILGMGRAEIRKKFDEIVAFAEVERFLDTPVKRYSSGMYVRLAFAVAAHLEPEILIVDEVLAVGDTEFQKKCLGKMGDVSRREGRTVLFVSHNMETVLKLCARGVLLGSGQVVEIGDASAVVAGYLRRNYSSSPEICLKDKPRSSGLPNRVRLSGANVIAPQYNWAFSFGQSLSFDIWVDSTILISSAELGIGLFSAKGYEIASWTNACSGEQVTVRPGVNAFRVEYDDLMLLPGQYFFAVGIRSGLGRDFEDYVPDAISFEVTASERSAEINGRTFGGVLVPRVRLSPLAGALPFTAYAGVEGQG
jgi:ABC-type polysaccharide/polyol phosphate transport system ATPase subunit